MRWMAIWLFTSSFGLFLMNCGEGIDEKALSPPVISNLLYEPSSIPIRLYQKTFTLNGGFEFDFAKSGVKSMHLVSSTGLNINIPVDGIVTDKGIINGSIEFTLPEVQTNISFDIWITDGAGRSSNKLTGIINIIIDGSGLQWTTSMAITDKQLWKVIWGNEKFVAVGDAGTIITSDNGLEWKAQTSGTIKDLRGLTWSGTQYIAVGTGGAILSSPDGVNWTVRAAGQTDSWLKAVSWNGNRFIAVGVKDDSNATEIMYSADGINWTRSSFLVQNGSLFGIAWSGNKWIAVGYKPNASLILSSDDGISWIDISLDNTGSILYDVIWTGSKFIAVGGGHSAISMDGANWTLKNISPEASGLRGVAVSPSTLLAVGDMGVYYSTDGLNWTPGNGQVPGHKSIVWMGVEFVIVGNWQYIWVSP